MSVPENILDMIKYDVMVLEDEAQPGLKMCRTLTQLGFKCFLVSNIDQAKVAIEKGENIDLILWDVHIHGRVPFELIKEAKEMNLGTLIVGVTANPQSPYIDKVKLICDEFLETKPISFELAEEINLKDKFGRMIRERREALQKAFKNIHNIDDKIQNKEIIVAKELEKDINYIAYRNMLPELKQKYLGLYVAFVDGIFGGYDENHDHLIDKIIDFHGKTDFLIQLIEPSDEILILRHPTQIDEDTDGELLK